MRVRIDPNEMRPGESFICWDVDQVPYEDGLGRPLRDVHGELVLAPRPALIGFSMDDAVARELADVWNKHQPDKGEERKEGESTKRSARVKDVRGIDNRLARFYVPDRWGADHWRLYHKLGVVTHSMVYNPMYQAFEVVGWHPDLEPLGLDAEIPLHSLRWQGNRMILVPFLHAEIVDIETKTFAPDWGSYQKRFPKAEFRVLWPNGDIGERP